MTNQEISLILSALKDKKINPDFVEFIKNSADKDFIDMICYHENIINLIPISIINMHLEEIIANADKILQNVVIKDSGLLKLILNRTQIEINTTIAMIQNYDCPENLHKEFPTVFPKSYILDYATVPLSDEFVDSCDSYMFGAGFLRNQVVREKVLRMAESEERYEIFRSIQNAGFKVNMSNEVAWRFWKRFDTDFLLENYSVPKNMLKTVVFSINDNEQHIMRLLSCSELDDNFVRNFVPDKHLHYYISFNKQLNEDMLIELYNSRKGINWDYVNSYMNLSKFPAYLKILYDNGQRELIEQNLITHQDDKIYNIPIIREMDLDMSCIDEYITKRMDGQSFAILNS